MEEDIEEDSCPICYENPESWFRLVSEASEDGQVCEHLYCEACARHLAASDRGECALCKRRVMRVQKALYVSQLQDRVLRSHDQLRSMGQLLEAERLARSMAEQAAAEAHRALLDIQRRASEDHGRMAELERLHAEAERARSPPPPQPPSETAPLAWLGISVEALAIPVRPVSSYGVLRPLSSAGFPYLARNGASYTHLFVAADDSVLRRVAVRLPCRDVLAILRPLAVLTRLRHPHVLPLLALAVDARSTGVLYAVSQRMYTHAACLAARNFLDEPRVLALGFQILCALAALHHCGLAHGALEPRHVLTTRELRVQLAGLWHVRPADRPIRHGLAPPLFQPPEWRSLYDGDGRPGDVWAVGVTLVVLLCGKRTEFAVAEPLAASWEAQVRQLRPDVQAPLLDVVRSLLVPDPLLRASAKDVVLSHPAFDAIRAQLKGRSVDQLVLPDSDCSPSSFSDSSISSFYSLGLCR